MTLFHLAALLITIALIYRFFQKINQSNVDNTNNSIQIPSIGIEEKDEVGDTYIELIQKANKAYEENNLYGAKYLLNLALKEKEEIEVLNKYAYVLALLNEDYEARRFYEKSLELDEKNEASLLGLASVLKKLKYFNESQEYYEKIIKLYPSNYVSYYNYANLLIEMKEKEKALENYKKALELKADFEPAKDEIDKLLDKE